MRTNFWAIINEEGKSMEENTDRLSFGIAVDRAIAWLAVSLLTWLCYSTMALREQMAVMIVRFESRDVIMGQIQNRLDKHLDEDVRNGKSK